MKRAILRTLFILGLGAGLGYVTAAVPIAPGKTVPAAPAEGAISVLPF